MAGEGCFYVTRKPTPYRDGTERPRFVFQLSMTRDTALMAQLRDFLGAGSLRVERHRDPRWARATVLTVASLKAHHAATIPFAESYLPCFTAKWRQYESWRDALIRHEAERPTRYGRGPSPCSVEGCGRPVRGRGLCRHHYYRATGY